MFAKSDVNGKNENPIYTFLKSRCPSVRKEFQASYKLYYEPYHQDDIRVNLCADTTSHWTPRRSFLILITCWSR